VDFTSGIPESAETFLSLLLKLNYERLKKKKTQQKKPAFPP